MPESIKLDSQQLEAIKFLKNHILDKTPVVCLLGAGGTGKTSIIHKLETENLNDKTLTFTATTNKAASIMRKDIPKAITMHSAISKYIPTNLYKDLENYFHYDGINEDTGKEINLQKDTNDFLKSKSQALKDLLSDHGNVDSFFRSINVDGYDPLIFSHYSTSEYLGGVCIVDESSMLPEKSIYKKDKFDKLKLQTIGLDILIGIYDTVILVGDGMQLPPINGKSSFDNKPQFNLTKNYRSEKDLLRLMQYAREGKSLELFVPKKGENIRKIRILTDRYINASKDLNLDLVHIVYKNKTRKEITKKIRGDDPQPNNGEPIVYYGANINDHGDSISKNEMGVFVDGYGEWYNHSQVINARSFDEYNTNPKVFSMLRYGYALTAHSAQGSSFDHGIIHLYDIPSFVDVDTQLRWCYTACSRFRKSVTLLLSGD